MPLAPRVDTCLRIMQRRAALLGLDAPSKTNVELDGAMRVHNECAPAISEKEAERRILEIVEQARKRELERPSGESLPPAPLPFRPSTNRQHEPAN
jgi:hypothetical protein